MNQLEITGLRTKTRIGVYAWEQHILQDLLIDLTIPLEKSAQDNLAQTVDYEQLCREVTDFIESQAFNLIETVAENLLEFIQHQFKISHLTIRVSKPHAISNAGNISVLMSR
jgi:7,8-dihydroneopterin aldolase/epimerase/oxygenase